MGQAPWLEKEAFGDPPNAMIFDWQPLNTGNLLASSYDPWLEAHYQDAMSFLEGTLGSHGRDEDELMRTEADR